MINDFPVPLIPVAAQEQFSMLTDEIIEAVESANESRTTDVQSRINRFVAELYALDDGERELTGMN